VWGEMEVLRGLDHPNIVCLFLPFFLSCFLSSLSLSCSCLVDGSSAASMCCVVFCGTQPLSFIFYPSHNLARTNEILTPPISSLPPHLTSLPCLPAQPPVPAPAPNFPNPPPGKILRMVRIPLQILPRFRTRRRRRTLRADPPAREVNRGGRCCCC
jgi:hypothetical protein